MDHSVHNKLVSFIWSIADDCLRDVYVRGKYRDVILPMVVLRRLDTLLEPTKQQVLDEVREQKEEQDFIELDPLSLQHVSGYVFYNTSKWTLKSLFDIPPLAINIPENINIGTAKRGKLSKPPNIDLTIYLALTVNEESSIPGNIDTIPKDIDIGIAIIKHIKNIKNITPVIIY